MRYAVLGDVHSNLEALLAVLEDAHGQGVASYLQVGDIVGYNADPGRCIDVLRHLNCHCVLGNHDFFCVNPYTPDDLSQFAIAGVLYARRELESSHLEFLAGLPRVSVFDGITVVHNTLRPDHDWDYVTSIPDAEESFAHQSTPVCFFGHTHVPIVFEKNGGVSVSYFQEGRYDAERVEAETTMAMELCADHQYLVNVGSVGQPRDRDPRAAYMIFDADKYTLELRRIPYDIAATREKITDARLPQWLGLRLGVGS